MIYQRRLLVASILLLLALPIIAFGAQQSFANILTLTSRWLPSTFSERRVLDQFMQEFESGDTVFLTWPGCHLDDTRLQKLDSALQILTESTGAAEHSGLIDSVMTAPEVVDNLTQPPSGLSRDEATRRLKGLLTGVDGHACGTLVGLTDKGVYRRNESIELILTESSRATSIAREEFILAGPPIDGWVVDREARSNVDSFTPPSIVISALLCMWCLRSWPHSVVVLTAALTAQGILLATMHFGGIRMNALFIVLPPLVLTLTVSAGIHLVNYFRDERDTHGSVGAVKRAMAHGRGPCLLAAGTTAIGLLSLVNSDITPVSQFGWLAAIGVVTGIGLLFLLLPGVLERWPGKAIERTALAPQDTQRDSVPIVSQMISRAPTVVVVLCLTFMAVMAIGVGSIETSIAHDSLFPDDSRIARDYRLLEDKFGPLVPAEVLLHFEPGSHLDFLKRLRLIQSIDEAISDMDGFGGTYSAALFVSDDVTKGTTRDVDGNRLSVAQRYVKLKADIKEQRHNLSDARLLYETDNRETWRISTRVPALGDTDYAESLGHLQAQVEQILNEHRHKKTAVVADYTGIMPMVSRVQEVLLHDLFVSFLSAFGLVTLVIVLVLRNVVAGLLVMLPNVFPAAIVFGAMGWLRIPVDIGAMMTASVALGIAVDDTFHYLTWFRRGIRDGLSTADAVQMAYHRCARAMVQTTLVAGLGMAVFGLSDFIPTQRFAWLMLTLLVAALIGDLVLLPALLSGFTRRVFAPKPLK